MLNQTAVTAKNYKEAGQVSRQMKDTERRQQEVCVAKRGVCFVAVHLLSIALGMLCFE